MPYAAVCSLCKASVACKPASGGMSSDDGSVVGGCSDGSVSGGEEPAPRRRRQMRQPMRVYIVHGVSEGGLWQSALPPGRPQGEGGQAPDRVIGLAFAKLAAKPLESQASSGLQRRLRDLALAQARRAATQGFLEYEMQSFFRLDSPLTLSDPTSTPPQIMDAIADMPGCILNFAEIPATRLQSSAMQCMQIWANERSKLMPTGSVKLANPVAEEISSGSCQLLHVVALTGKLDRKRLLDEGDAPKKRLRRMRAELPGAPAECQVVEKRWAGSEGVRDPDLMLNWLECSQDLKQQGLANTACLRFARLLSSRNGIPVERLLDNMEFASGRLLIKSRLRLDCTANLLHRQWWVSVCNASDLGVHIFCDASPQWRGIELFATTVDFWVEGSLVRRLAPLVSLSKTQLDQHGKLGAMLWQLSLMAGPTSETLKRLCSAVRSITTDFGTERLLSDSKACLDPFFASWSGNDGQNANDRTLWLFETCVHMPGFRHMIDNLIQKGLSSMKSFLGFLSKLKALVRLLRSELIMGEICRRLQREGLPAVVEMIRKSSLANFAAWRWGTLAQVCGALSCYLETLVDNFDFSTFVAAEQRDSEEAKQVCAALRSPAWHRMFHFVNWFASELTGLMNWVGGCSCHDVGDNSAEAKKCTQKGRRLTEAYDKVLQVVTTMLDEANSWPPAHFGGDLELWRECQGAVRFTNLLAREKAAFLDKVPYLLARLSEASMGTAGQQASQGQGASHTCSLIEGGVAR